MATHLPSRDASWRDSARYPKFFIFDSRSVFPLLVWMLHMRLWTFVLAILTMAFFSILLRFGFTLAMFLRWLRASIGGKRKAAIPWWAYTHGT